MKSALDLTNEIGNAIHIALQAAAELKRRGITLDGLGVEELRSLRDTAEQAYVSAPADWADR